MLKHGFEGLIPNSPDTNNPLTRRIGRGDETSSCNRPFLSHPRQLVTASDSGERIKRHLVTDRPLHLCLLVSASALEERMKPQGFRAGSRLQIQRGGLQAFGLDGESGGAFYAGAGTDYHGEFT